MQRGVRLPLLCALLLVAFWACGQITHDIGQVKADNQKSDGDVSSETGDSLDAGRGSEDETSNAGREEPRRDAGFDGSGLDGAMAQDAEEVNLAEDAEIHNSDASDALGDECVAERIEVEFEPLELDVYIMMDALLFTGFWSPVPTPDQLILWTEVRREISAFVDDPDSEGIGVGIQYYGQLEFDGDPMTSTSCEVSTYSQPAVPIAKLPDNAEDIKDSFPDVPFPTSPAVPALEGAILLAKSRVTTHQGRRQVVFLITGPSVLGIDPICGSSTQDLYPVAERGYSRDPSVATYVIGIYRSIEYTALLDALRGVAIRGGSSHPYPASISRENPELEIELGKARDDAKRSACAFHLSQEYQESLPTAIDPDLASIVVTTDDNETIALKRVYNHLYCNSGETGWHFDDPTNPNELVPCEKTCEELASKSISRVELRLRCPD